MRGQTYQATIIRGSGQQSYFTVIELDFCNNVTFAELSYDEMLGWLARNFCPTMSDGTPCRGAGAPLFLKAPEKKSTAPTKSTSEALDEVLNLLTATELGGAQLRQELRNIIEKIKTLNYE